MHTHLADHSGVLGVVTFGLLPAEGRAVGDLALQAITQKAVHVHGTFSFTEMGTGRGLLGPQEPKLSTHHRSIGQVPLIVADSAPGVTFVDLNPATLEVISTDQPNGIWSSKKWATAVKLKIISTQQM